MVCFINDVTALCIFFKSCAWRGFLDLHLCHHYWHKCFVNLYLYKFHSQVNNGCAVPSCIEYTRRIIYVYARLREPTNVWTGCCEFFSYYCCVRSTEYVIVIIYAKEISVASSFVQYVAEQNKISWKSK